MVDPVVLVALALLGGAPLALAPYATSAAAFGVFLAIRRRISRLTAMIAVAALLIGGLRARAALAGADATYAAVVDLLTPPARCSGPATVVSSPVVLGRPTPGGVAEAPASEGEDKGRVDVEIAGGTCGDRVIRAAFRARLYGAPEDLARGDELEIVADLAPVHLFRNPDLSDARPAIARSGVAASGGALDVRVVRRAWSLTALIDRARAHVRRRIERTFHPDAAALARALVLGESDLLPVDDDAFRVSGLSHLLAVSGTHLVVAILGFAAVLRACLTRVQRVSAAMDVGRVVAAIAAPTAWLYADFAGGSGSAIRAAAMLSATLVAQAACRRAPVVRSFACSMAALALSEPLLACDLSFGLSASATVGLVVLQKPLEEAIARGPAIAHGLLTSVATTLAATIGCAPVLAVIAPTMPALGVFANLIAAPVGELAALPICLAHAILAWSPSLESGTALLGSGALLGVRAIARWSASTGAVIPVPPPTNLQLATLAVTAAFTWTATTRASKARRLAVGAALWIVAEIAAHAAGAPEGVLRVTFLDVGQGDAALIDLPDGTAILLDGGGMVGSPVDLGARVLQPVLRARRRRRVDVMILSHPHPDHFGGLVSTMDAVQVGELWDTGQGEDLGAGPAYASLLQKARSKGVPVRRPRDLCGSLRRAGGATIEVLAPCPGYTPDASANDSSFVVRLVYGDRRALLVGDAEGASERTLIERYGDGLHVDVLKVGHHGSRTSSSPAFLRALRPALAVISSGVRNRFGHPHPLTLAALAKERIPTLRTDRGGAVIWETDGREVTITRP